MGVAALRAVASRRGGVGAGNGGGAGNGTSTVYATYAGADQPGSVTGPTGAGASSDNQRYDVGNPRPRRDVSGYEEVAQYAEDGVLYNTAVYSETATGEVVRGAVLPTASTNMYNVLGGAVASAGAVLGFASMANEGRRKVSQPVDAPPNHYNALSRPTRTGGGSGGGGGGGGGNGNSSDATTSWDGYEMTSTGYQTVSTSARARARATTLTTASTSVYNALAPNTATAGAGAGAGRKKKPGVAAPFPRLRSATTTAPSAAVVHATSTATGDGYEIAQYPPMAVRSPTNRNPAPGKSGGGGTSNGGGTGRRSNGHAASSQEENRARTGGINRRQRDGSVYNGFDAPGDAPAVGPATINQVYGGAVVCEDAAAPSASHGGAINRSGRKTSTYAGFEDEEV